MATTTAAAHGFDDRLARRNAAILFVAQSLYGLAVSTVIMVGGIAGQMLAGEAALATVPITAFVLGTALSTAPMSLFMQRFGRRAGFLLGALWGLAGCLIAVYAIVIGSFWLFCLGTHLCGYYQASAGYYRFAAADTASESYRPKAISWVLAGGLAAAFFAREVVPRTQHWLDPYLFAGCFLASAIAVTLAAAVLLFVQIPVVRKAAVAGESASGRPLPEILKDRRLIAAIVTGMIGYGMMNFIMTATPLAMLGCGLSVEESAHAISWHIVGMYLPSFFTGPLIARVGREPVVILGLLLLAGCGVVALSGLSFEHFTLAMVLLGLGWNFAYIGATALVTDSHRPEERGKVQAFNDFVIFGFVAVCSFLSGSLLEHLGWNALNITLLVFVAVATVIVLVLPRLDRARKLA
jgi:MFS family permease